MFPLRLARPKPKQISRLPNHVHDVMTSICVFCPYGAEVKPGDLAYAFDERTVFRRQQRERLVKVTAVKSFRSTGRLVTIDLKIARESELLRIAEDSEITMEALYEHRTGNDTYIDGREPVVVFFKPHDEDDTLGAQAKSSSRVQTLRPRRRRP